MLKCASIGDTFVIAIAVNKSIYIGKNERSEGAEDHVTFELLHDFQSPICALGISQRYVAASCEGKTIVSWENEGWTQISHSVLPKRITSLMFTSDDDFILTCDKSGEVRRYPTKSLDSDSPSLLGHSSMLLDMKLLRDVSSGMKFIATCDRDEKIRISHYPNCYNIHSYCLHHSNFVTCLCVVSLFPHLLISGSADGTVNLWKWHSSQLLYTLDCSQSTKESSVPIVTTLCTTNKMAAPVLAIATNVYILSSITAPVQLYEISTDGQLHYCSSVNVNGMILSALFDVNDHLWLMYKSFDNDCVNLNCFSIKDKNVIPVNSGPLLGIINSSLAGIVVRDFDWNQLLKQDFDNMSNYLVKKNERIQSKRMKLEEESTLSESTVTSDVT